MTETNSKMYDSVLTIKMLITIKQRAIINEYATLATM